MGQFCTAAPARPRRCVARSSRVKRRLAKLAKHDDVNPNTVATWQTRPQGHEAPRGPKPPFHHPDVGGRSSHGRVSPASAMAVGGLPICLASHAASPHALVTASRPAAAWHQLLTGHGRRAACQEAVQVISDRVLPYRYRGGPHGRER